MHPYHNIRRAVKAAWNAPVILTDSDDPPELKGESWHYTTKTGKPIYYPSAYSKIGWSSMVYHRSTYHITVGIKWTAEYCPEALAHYAKERMHI
jgi:hypothetical protein